MDQKGTKEKARPQKIGSSLCQTMEANVARYLISEHGGLVFIKLCQWLCHREDVVPSQIRAILKPLQDHVPNDPRRVESLQRRNEDLGDLVGSGSVSLVFDSKSQPEFVVKILRHKVRHRQELLRWRTIFGTFQAGHVLSHFGLNMGQAVLDTLTSIQHPLDLLNLDTYTGSGGGGGGKGKDRGVTYAWDFSALDIHGFLDIIEQQLSYSNEVFNYQYMRKALEPLDFVVLPTVLEQRGSSLYMTKIEGHSYSVIESDHPEYALDMRQKMLMAYFWMIHHKVIHIDLHDGNYLYVIHPDDDRKNQVAILDYGMCALPCDSMYWDLWKAYVYRQTRDLHRLVAKMIITPSHKDRLKKIDFYRKRTSLSFTEWLDDLMVQIASLGLVISAESSNVLIGFVLLGRNNIRGADGTYETYDIMGTTIDKMANNTNPAVAQLGKELQEDLRALREE